MDWAAYTCPLVVMSPEASSVVTPEIAPALVMPSLLRSMPPGTIAKQHNFQRRTRMHS